MATGVVKSIEANRTSALIINDENLSEISTTEVARTLEIEDGVSYDDNGGVAENIDDITKVKLDGTLTNDETKMLQALVRSINKRGGGGGVKIEVKTKN